MIESTNNRKNPFTALFWAHSLFYTALVSLTCVYFQFDIPHTLWATYANDSWKFIANMLHPEVTPFPYHLQAASAHYFFPYTALSILVPETTALFLAVIFTQYIFSLGTLYLIYRLFRDNLELSSRFSVFLTIFIEMALFSPFLMLATAEILFIFYQALAWHLFSQEKYFTASLSAAMTFALRFNGAFFVTGFIIVYLIKTKESREFEVSKIFRAVSALFLMFLIGFSSFIWSYIRQGDFWHPLAAEIVAYQRWEVYASSGVITLPFLWWINYVIWVVNSNAILEIALFLLAVVFFALAMFSIVSLHQQDSLSVENKAFLRDLLVFYTCGFIGANMIVSGRNFTRFVIGIYPVLPFLPLWLKKRTITDKMIVGMLLLGIAVAILTNILFWSAVEPLVNCMPYFG